MSEDAIITPVPEPPEPEVCGYRYRLDPNAQQTALFRQIVGSCRFVWNLFLQQRIDIYKATKDVEHEREWVINKAGEAVLGYHEHHMNYYYQANQLKPLKKIYPWLKVVPAQSLQQVLVDLEKSYTNFFSGGGFPKKKRKDDTHQSFRYPQGEQLGIHGNRVFLPNIGWVKFFKSQDIPKNIKSATVSFDQDHWHISFCCERPAIVNHQFTKASIALDLGVINHLTDEHNNVYMLPTMNRDERKRVKYLQRQAGKKKLDGKNRAKAQKKFRTEKRKINCRIDDARHKLTTYLAKNHRQINVEDLSVKNMTASAKGTVEAPGKNVKQKSGLNRALLEIGFGEIRRQFEYKCKRFGGKCVAVPPKDTSRRCPNCHHTEKANRLTRDTFCCVQCLFTAPADQVGAINVNQKAVGQTVSACPVAKPRRHRNFSKKKPVAITTFKQEPVPPAMRELSLPAESVGIPAL